MCLDVAGTCFPLGISITGTPDHPSLVLTPTPVPGAFVPSTPSPSQGDGRGSGSPLWTHSGPGILRTLLTRFLGSDSLTPGVGPSQIPVPVFPNRLLCDPRSGRNPLGSAVGLDLKVWSRGFRDRDSSTSSPPRPSVSQPNPLAPTPMPSPCQGVDLRFKSCRIFCGRPFPSGLVEYTKTLRT